MNQPASFKGAVGKIAVVKSSDRKHPCCVGNEQNGKARPGEGGEKNKQCTQMDKDIRNTTEPLHTVLCVVRFTVGLRRRADPLG